MRMTMAPLNGACPSDTRTVPVTSCACASSPPQSARRTRLNQRGRWVTVTPCCGKISPQGAGRSNQCDRHRSAEPSRLTDAGAVGSGNDLLRQQHEPSVTSQVQVPPCRIADLLAGQLLDVIARVRRQATRIFTILQA